MTSKLITICFSFLGDKSLKLVLRGLPLGLLTKEVKEELNKPTVVLRMRVRKRNRKKEVDMMMVSVVRDKRTIYDLTRFCSFVISIKSFNRKKGSEQRSRCQKCDHAQSGCRAKPVCTFG